LLLRASRHPPIKEETNEQPFGGDPVSPKTNFQRLFTWRSAICESDLPPTARHVALTLALHMNELGGSCFPGGARLTRETGLSMRTVRTALATLEQVGWLTVTHRGSSHHGQKRTANEYEASYPATMTGAGDTPVQEIHRCSPGNRPVQLTTPTGATAAPQVFSSTSENSSLATTSVEAEESGSLRSSIIKACGWDPESVSKSASGTLAKAVKDIRGCGGTAEEVAIRADAYRAQWPDIALTPSALAKHWPALSGTHVTAGSVSPQLSPACRTAAAIRSRTRDRDEAASILRDEYYDIDVDEVLAEYDRLIQVA